MRILGVESSCDETAAAVVEDGKTILSSVVASQIPVHAEFGGVVPELASREHMRSIIPVVDQALVQAGVSLDTIDAVAVTHGPGLVGSLLIGLGVAKSLAWAHDKPLVGVNHLEAHIMAAFMGDREPRFPMVALVVSGGHTNLYLVQGVLSIKLLGQTRDDAAGEAFDKVAKVMGLGYPGGVIIDKIAAKGDPDAIAFTRPMIHSGSLEFSFSGLKTAVISYLREHPLPEDLESRETADLAASFQEAVVDVLTLKAIQAAELHKVSEIALAGGVAANSRLRHKLGAAAREKGIHLNAPHISLCTDNAIMVAALGYHRLQAGLTDSLELDAYSRAVTPWMSKRHDPRPI